MELEFWSLLNSKELQESQTNPKPNFVFDVQYFEFYLKIKKIMKKWKKILIKKKHFGLGKTYPAFYIHLPFQQRYVIKCSIKRLCTLMILQLDIMLRMRTEMDEWCSVPIGWNIQLFRHELEKRSLSFIEVFHAPWYIEHEADIEMTIVIILNHPV